MVSKHIKKILTSLKSNSGFNIVDMGNKFQDYLHINPFLHDSPYVFLICALSCYRNEPESPSDKSIFWGSIAPFARRNYYAEAIHRMKNIFREIRKIIPVFRKQGRIFSNSRLPENSLVSIPW